MQVEIRFPIPVGPFNLSDDDINVPYGVLMFERNDLLIARGVYKGQISTTLAVGKYHKIVGEFERIKPNIKLDSIFAIIEGHLPSQTKEVFESKIPIYLGTGFHPPEKVVYFDDEVLRWALDYCQNGQKDKKFHYDSVVSELLNESVVTTERELINVLDMAYTRHWLRQNSTPKRVEKGVENVS